ncbi:unnamed protein product [Phaeothamnion confervicola]
MDPDPAGGAAGSDQEDLTPAQRRERRKIRNRVSARLHRERQKEHMDRLETLLKEKDAALAAQKDGAATAERELRRQLEELREHNDALRRRVSELEAEHSAFDAAVSEMDGITVPVAGDGPDAAAVGDVADLLQHVKVFRSPAYGAVAAPAATARSAASSDGYGTTTTAASGTDDSGDSSGDSDQEQGDTEDADVIIAAVPGGPAGLAPAAPLSSPLEPLSRRGPIARQRSLGAADTEFFAQLDDIELADLSGLGEEGIMDIDAELEAVAALDGSSSVALPLPLPSPVDGGHSGGGGGDGGGRGRRGAGGVALFGLMSVFTIFGSGPFAPAVAPIWSRFGHLAGAGSAAVDHNSSGPDGVGRVLVAAPPPGAEQHAVSLPLHNNGSAALWASREMWGSDADVRRRHGGGGGGRRGDSIGGSVGGGREWVLSPLESEPRRWRNMGGGSGAGSPWRYREAAQLFGPDAWLLGEAGRVDCNVSHHILPKGGGAARLRGMVQPPPGQERRHRRAATAAAGSAAVGAVKPWRPLHHQAVVGEVGGGGAGAAVGRDLIAKEVDVYRPPGGCGGCAGGNQRALAAAAAAAAAAGGASCDKDGWVRGTTLPEKGSAGTLGTSYMFCPQAYGVMSPGLVPAPAKATYRRGGGGGGSGAGGSGSSGRAADAAVETVRSEAAVARVITTTAAVGGRDRGDSDDGVSSGSDVVSHALVAAMPPPLHHGTGHGDAPGSGGAQGEYLLLLVPSGAVDWGERSGDMRHAFNATASNENADTDGSGGGSGGNGGGSTGWLEIGCQVLNARLVRDVHFSV